MAVKDTITTYLSGRKLPATSKAIAKYAKLNHNTVRKVLGQMASSLTLWDNVKCPIDKQYRQGYSL